MAVLVSMNYKGLEVRQPKNAPSAKNADAKLKDAILDRLLEANDIEVPQDQVDEEVSMMVLELNHRLKYEGLATGRFTTFSQDEMDAQMELIKAEACKSVKTRLVLKGIIVLENLQVTRAELDEEARAIAARQNMDVEMVKSFLGEDLSSLREDLLVRKALDLVNTSAVIQ